MGEMEMAEKYPEGFDASCGVPADAMREANMIAASLTGKRAWDVPCIARVLESRASHASHAGGAVAAGHFVRRSKFGPWIEIDPAKEKGGTPLYTHPAPASKEPVADERAAFEAIAKDQCLPLRRTGCTYDDDATQAAWAVYLQARAALATAQTWPEPKSSNPNAGGTQAYLATEHYNEGWNDCRNAMLAAAPAKPEGV